MGRLLQRAGIAAIPDFPPRAREVIHTHYALGYALVQPPRVTY